MPRSQEGQGSPASRHGIAQDELAASSGAGPVPHWKEQLLDPRGPLRSAPCPPGPSGGSTHACWKHRMLSRMLNCCHRLEKFTFPSM